MRCQNILQAAIGSCKEHPTNTVVDVSSLESKSLHIVCAVSYSAVQA